jgi:hypothetical protein
MCSVRVGQVEHLLLLPAPPSMPDSAGCSLVPLAACGGLVSQASCVPCLEGTAGVQGAGQPPRCDPWWVPGPLPSPPVLASCCSLAWPLRPPSHVLTAWCPSIVFVTASHRGCFPYVCIAACCFYTQNALWLRGLCAVLFVCVRLRQRSELCGGTPRRHGLHTLPRHCAVAVRVCQLCAVHRGGAVPAGVGWPAVQRARDVCGGWMVRRTAPLPKAAQPPFPRPLLQRSFLPSHSPRPCLVPSRRLTSSSPCGRLCLHSLLFRSCPRRSFVSVCDAGYSGVRCDGGCADCAGTLQFASASGVVAVSEEVGGVVIALERRTGTAGTGVVLPHPALPRTRGLSHTVCLCAAHTPSPHLHASATSEGFDHEGQRYSSPTPACKCHFCRLVVLGCDMPSPHLHASTTSAGLSCWAAPSCPPPHPHPAPCLRAVTVSLSLAPGRGNLTAADFVTTLPVTATFAPGVAAVNVTLTLAAGAIEGVLAMPAWRASQRLAALRQRLPC